MSILRAGWERVTGAVLARVFELDVSHDGRRDTFALGVLTLLRPSVYR